MELAGVRKGAASVETKDFTSLLAAYMLNLSWHTTC